MRLRRAAPVAGLTFSFWNAVELDVQRRSRRVCTEHLVLQRRSALIDSLFNVMASDTRHRRGSRRAAWTGALVS